MASHDEDDDPAVYRSGSTCKQQEPAPAPQNDQKPTQIQTNGAPNGQNLPSASSSASSSPHGPDEDEDTSAGSHSGSDEGTEDDDGDGTLLTVQPGYNRLLLVLRDEGVMRFVKYVSAAAESSRWDVCGEYEVGAVQEESE